MDKEELRKLGGKNWTAALLFCWFMGSIGAHRFYTGKNSSGWVMLVLTCLLITAPLTFLWSVFDGFNIVLGNFKHADGSELYEKISWLGYTYIFVMLLTLLGVIGYIKLGTMLFNTFINSGGIGNIPIPGM